MTRASDITQHGFGLCRKPPAACALPTGTGIRSEPEYEGLPDGGAGGSGTIRRGVGAALSGLKTLIHNPQLLWFALMVGLVLAGHFAAQWALIFASVNRVPDLIGSPVVTFMVELPTVFCLAFLLAGLTLSLSSEKDDPVSFFHGLSRAKKYLRPLTGWSVAMALAGTLLFNAGGNYGSPGLSWSLWSPLWQFLYNVLSQFPFNWTLNPVVFVSSPPDGGVTPLMVMYPSALIYSLIFLAINALLFCLTLFVVPLIVIERKRLKEAVSGSFALMRKCWGEVAACVLGLGIVLFAALLTFLLFGVTGISQVLLVHGITSISSPRPGDAWIAAGILYDIALSGFAFIVATVGGIAILDLYTSAKNRQVAESAENTGGIR